MDDVGLQVRHLVREATGVKLITFKKVTNSLQQLTTLGCMISNGSTILILDTKKSGIQMVTEV